MNAAVIVAAGRGSRMGLDRNKVLYPLCGEPIVVRTARAFADSGLFDGGVVSSYVHQVKPEKEIYETILTRYGIEAQRALFIDDVQGNIEGAMKTGIHGFHMHESGMLDRFFL